MIGYSWAEQWEVRNNIGNNSQLLQKDATFTFSTLLHDNVMVKTLRLQPPMIFMIRKQEIKPIAFFQG